MALDGAFLRVIRNELAAVLIGARVDKIYQPAKDEIIITLRTRTQGGFRLLMSANANHARVHFTGQSVENPKAPPMFCMLLRKHLGSAKLVAVRQQEMDRILYLDFETINELGDLVVVTIVVEIMGRHSNIILLGAENRIIDSIKRVSEDISSVRPILPGMRYELPPGQNKRDLTLYDESELLHQFFISPQEDIAKAAMQCWQGISPILAREIALSVTGGLPLAKKQLTAVHEQRLIEQLRLLKNVLSENAVGKLKLYLAAEQNHKPKDFTVLPIRQYGDFMEILEFSSTGALLDAFYGQRDKMERMKQRSNDLLKLVVNRMERVTKKIALWEDELRHSANREVLREYGDLLNSNLWQMEKGMRQITLDNFYDDNKAVTIPLDVRLTPAKNAQKYYTEYRKAATAEQKITELMEDARQEEQYLDSVWDLIVRCETEAELGEIRQELAEQGFVKRNAKEKCRPDKIQPPMKFITSDGFTVYCGRNNKQNDKLTLKDARNYDMWLHTQKIPGSHVVIVADGREIPNRSIEEAAIIAAYHSRGRESAQVPVDYTLIRNVKKPRGAKPGMVIFVDYKTAYVTPDENLVNALRADK